MLYSHKHHATELGTSINERNPQWRYSREESIIVRGKSHKPKVLRQVGTQVTGIGTKKRRSEKGLAVTYGQATVTYGGQDEKEGRTENREKGATRLKEERREEEIFLEKIGAIDPSTKKMEATLEEMRG
ncbi:hypothetical protein L1987_31387 [Smallanthus sonchifolius]|uniref:Uncharacterized protein n=1 Tax=Smallanthus sonchifolius TaxID=185202 RepID=A0ACB9I6M6_9ASTR|nr:hypothetical protein L1987_31387 [Smallanthus sonchifolius]